jgi:hypothetical protein
VQKTQVHVMAGMLVYDSYNGIPHVLRVTGPGKEKGTWHCEQIAPAYLHEPAHVKAAREKVIQEWQLERGGSYITERIETELVERIEERLRALRSQMWSTLATTLRAAPCAARGRGTARDKLNGARMNAAALDADVAEYRLAIEQVEAEHHELMQLAQTALRFDGFRKAR